MSRSPLWKAPILTPMFLCIPLIPVAALSCTARVSMTSIWAMAGMRFGPPRLENEPRIQRCIDQLEAEGAQLILLCCCLRYPLHRFHSTVPVVFPWKTAFNYVQALADTMERPKVGVVIGRGQNWQRDIEMWTNYDGFRNVEFHFGVGHCTGGEEALPEKLDLVVVWGYHTFDYRDGKIGDEECLELKYEKEFNCPVISSASSAFLFARGLMRPVIDEKSYYAPVKL